MNKIKNKKLILISVILTLIVIIGVSINFNSPSKSISAETPINYALTKFKQQQEQDNKEPNKTFIKINNEEFSNKEFNTFKRNANLIQRANGNAELNYESVKKEFIKSVVLEQKAKKENAFVTKKEAKAVVKEVKEQFRKNDNFKNQKSKKFLKGYIASLEISEEKYWNEYAVEAYQNILSEMELKKQFVSKYESKTTSKNFSTFDTDGSDLKNLNKAWEEYQLDLVKSSKIELVSE